MFCWNTCGQKQKKKCVEGHLLENRERGSQNSSNFYTNNFVYDQGCQMKFLTIKISKILPESQILTKNFNSKKLAASDFRFEEMLWDFLL